MGLAACACKQTMRYTMPYTTYLQNTGEFLYAPSLVSLVEKERRNGISTKRFKYAGAIDMSKCYPKSGSLDDCALLRPVGE